MKNLKYFVVGLALIALSSCKENEYFLFDNKATLQFGHQSPFNQPAFDLADTLKRYTFFYENPDVKQDTVFFDIYAIGGSSSKDRSFKLEQVQVNGTANAVAGTHFVAFNDPAMLQKYVIKADSVHSLVPVVLLRDPSLLTSDAVLKFTIVANENFQLGDGKNLWRKINFTDRISQPSNWSVTTYGKYSLVKHKFMYDSTNELWDQAFIELIKADIPLVQFYLSKVKTALANYNNAHPGNFLGDESGELVVFP